MDRLFATLFTLYIVGTIVSALIRKMRTEPGPSLPPIHRPDSIPWPFEAEVEPTPPGEPHAPRVEERIPSEVEAQPSLPPAEELAPLPEETKEVLEEPASRAPAYLDVARSVVAAHQAVAASSALERKVGLTPAKVREALILTEIVAPPRALRPYTPFPWRR